MEEKEVKVQGNEFIQLADLTAKQLFHYNNCFGAIEEKDQPTLVFGALRHILSTLTNQYVRSSSKQQPTVDLQNSISQAKAIECSILRNLLLANQTILNYSFTDRILRRIHSIEGNTPRIIKEIVDNFEFGAKTTVTLIPQILLQKQTINQNQLLEMCQASERFLRTRLRHSENELQR
jgi:hypothetical protein